MIAIATSHDWLGASIDIDVGGPPQTFVASAAADAASAMDELAAWAAVTFGGVWSWQATRDAITSGWVITLSTLGAYSISASATAQPLYGLAAGVHGPASSITFDTAAAGTWAPLGGVAVDRWSRYDDEAWPASGVGVARLSSPSTAPYRPEIRAAGTALDAARFATIAAAYGSPRRVRVRDDSVSPAPWRSGTLGAVSRARIAGAWWSWSLEVRG